MGIRRDGREPDDLRPVAFTRDFTELAPGSVLVEFGRTRVLCTASVEERVPPWLRGKGRGWVTAEYSMLPGSTSRAHRPRGAEGRAVGPHPGDPAAHRPLAPCGHRSRPRWARCRSPSTATCSRPTAAPARRRSAAATSRCTTRARGSIATGTSPMTAHPLTDACGAISVGIVDGLAYLDLDYSEDVRAEVDMNVVMTGAGRFVEVQGTAEGMPFSRGELDDLLGLAESGIDDDLRAAARAAGGGPRAAPMTLRSCSPPRIPTRRARSPTCSVDAGAPSRARGAPAGPSRRRRDRRDARGERAAQGGRAVRPATGLPAIADDTGLEVDALGGAPGVHSARFAGDDATYADNVAPAARAARGRAGRPPHGAVLHRRDRPLARRPRGGGHRLRRRARSPASARGAGGFGYDPVFVPTEGDGRTFAEMSAAEKHACSHRGRAFRTLADGLRVVAELDET